MKKISRVLAVLLVASQLIAMAACSPQSTPTGTSSARGAPTLGNSGATPSAGAPNSSALGGSLDVMILKDNPGQDVPTQTQIQDWAKQSGVKTTVEVSTLSELPIKVSTIIQSGSGPDVFIVQGYGAQLYSESLLDLTGVATEIDTQDGGFYDIAKQVGMVGDTWKAIPVYIYMHQLVYRKDILSAIGEKVPDTWDDFVKVSKEIEQKYGPSGMDAFGVSFSSGSDGAQFVQGVLWAFGSKMLSEDGKTVTFDSAETVAGLKYIIDLYNQKLVPAGVLAWDDSSNNKAFLASQIAMTVNGSSIKAQTRTVSEDLYNNTGLAVYPQGPAGRYSFPNPFSFVVRKNTANPEAAKSLLRYLFQPENYSQVITTTGGSIGTSLKGFANLGVWNAPDTRAMLDAISTARLTGWPAKPSKISAEVDSEHIIVNMVGRVINDHLTPEAAVKEAASKIQNVVDTVGSK